jgi:hypothetical protein
MCRARRTYRAGCVCPHDTSYRAAAKAAGPGAGSLTHGFSLFLRKETLDFGPFRLESRIIFLHDLDAMSSLTNDSDYPAVRANGSRAGRCYQRLAIAAGGSCADRLRDRAGRGGAFARYRDASVEQIIQRKKP